MVQKKVKQLLNELIAEEKGKIREKRADRIAALDIPVLLTESGYARVDLNPVVIFDGIESVVFQLLEQIRESCFLGQTDVTASVNVERSVCPQLHELGIFKVSFYSPVENMERLPQLYDQLTSHLRYIFNALQSPSIGTNLWNDPVSPSEDLALLFPFNREATGDQTGWHYLVEKNRGAHFLRITAEEMEHARLNLRRINHRIVSGIELINDHYNVRSIASTIFASIVTQSNYNKRAYNDSGLQLGSLLHFLQKAGYTSLTGISLNWTPEVISDLLIKPGPYWFGSIYRMLLMLSDSTTVTLLSNNQFIETVFSETHIFLSLTQRKRNLQIDLQEKVKIKPLDHYTTKMPSVQRVADSGPTILNDVHIILVHHFTAETLAVLGAFDKMGVHEVDTLWVKYSGSIPPAYLETILSLPGSVYRFWGIEPLNDDPFTRYFGLNERFSSADHIPGLEKKLAEGKLPFYESMQTIAMYLFLNAMMNAGEQTKVVIVEDGGYLAPLVNRLALEGKRVAEVFEQFGIEQRFKNEDEKESLFEHWLSSRFVGSVEHTRNGFDALKEVENQFSRLAFPACSLAISRFKVNDESIEVACSCINAIENILNGQGYVLNNRHCLVLGSMGAIGSQLMKMLLYRSGSKNLVGIDIRASKEPSGKMLNYSRWEDLPDEVYRFTDLIIGVIGQSVLPQDFFERMVWETTCQELFLASGSTKQYEYTDFMNWTSGLLAAEQPSIRGIPVKVTTRRLDDPQTGAMLGSVLQFHFSGGEKNGKKVDFYLLGNLMPVNFQYYGVPRETMDRVMSELVILTKIISQAKEKALPARVLALDHNIDQEGRLLTTS